MYKHVGTFNQNQKYPRFGQLWISAYSDIVQDKYLIDSYRLYIIGGLYISEYTFYVI